MTVRYIDLQRVGEGATAFVYRALDRELDCLVAIKLIKPAIPERERILDALRNEVRISRILRDSSICPIHDLYHGPEGEGVVMDWLEGMELRKWMDDHRGRLLDTAGERLTVLGKLAAAFVVAHTHIVHRDLKPANIYLRDGDPSRPVIMDFGIAWAGLVAEGEELIAGTPKYMAPEQFEAPATVDARADLFALGVLAYELFTDRIPPTSLVHAPRTGVVPRVELVDVKPPSSFCAAVPPALDRLILQLMSYDRDDRPRDAREVVDALAKIVLVTELPELETDARDNGREKVHVPGGLFYIGSRPGAGSAKGPDRPPRQIVVNPFRIDRHPVTNADYRRFVETTGFRRPPWLDDRVLGRADQPVVGVTWEEAAAYARWVGGELPSEAQWECAARAGRNFVEYPWGDEPPTATRANIGFANSAPTPVGAYPPGDNPLGIGDLCGNVWEWCRDDWEAGFYGRLAKWDRDPVGRGDGARKSLRGGSFDSIPVQGRCAFRFHAPADSRRNSIGFRVAYPDGGAPEHHTNP